MGRSVSRKKKTRRNGDLICYTRFAAGDVKAFRKRIFPGSEYSGAALREKAFHKRREKRNGTERFFGAATDFIGRKNLAGAKIKRKLAG